MTEESTMVEVGGLTFQFDDKELLFSPSDDITPKEVCLILQAVLNVLAHKGNVRIDLGTFIEKHNLSKHFSEVV